MKYVSTRGQAPELDFSGVLLAGLAVDGGLYMPSHWPRFSKEELRALRGLPYAELAARVMAPFVGAAIPFAELQKMCRRAYAGFDHAATVPLVQLGTSTFALELFHGPTLAFKDLALQLAGHLFEYVLAQTGEKVRIVGATSGDTGSAAIEAMA
ncbi:MAG: threonine synthase, partial [Acidocella sp.]|nr:threonine synthase [Acidocella sp.]